MTLLRRWIQLKDHLSQDVGGGPRPWKFAWVINAQKGLMMPWVALLMYSYDVWTPTAWTYLALHGTYGLCWLLKDRVLPDPGWEKWITVPAGLFSWLAVLGPYAAFPWILVSTGYEAPTWLLAVATILHTLGVVVMMGADAQKFFVLKVKRGLITDGFFARVRHPNYLGEMMLYGSFALLVGHWFPYVVLAWVWLGVFTPNMLAKEASMARYPEWAAYKARTGMVIPWFFGSSAQSSAPAAKPTPASSDAQTAK